MKTQHTPDPNAVQSLIQALADAIGPNAPPPTTQEIAAHKQRAARQRLNNQRHQLAESTRSMKIDMTNVDTPSGFYPVTFETFGETLAESKITFSIDMGGVTLHHGTREGAPIWLMDNPSGCTLGYAIWVEEDEQHQH